MAVSTSAQNLIDATKASPLPDHTGMHLAHSPLARRMSLSLTSCEGNEEVWDLGDDA